MLSASLFGCADKAADSPSATTTAPASATTTVTASATASIATTTTASEAPVVATSSGPVVAAPETAAATAGDSASGSVAKPIPPTPTGKAPPRPRPTKGRPFVVNGVERTATASRRQDWQQTCELPPILDADRDCVAAHYLEMALAEHASVASFARFTLQLLAVGAPAALVAGSSRAMGEEISHAQFAFGVTSALRREPVGPASLDVMEPKNKQLDHDLASVVRSTVREGILGETLAALELKAAARHAHPLLRARLESIAEDEARHAELAFAFVAWALDQDPMIAHIVQQELAHADPSSPPDLPALEPWGVLDAATIRAVRADGLHEVVEPILDRMLARGLCGDSSRQSLRPSA